MAASVVELRIRWRQGEIGRGGAILMGSFHGHFHIFNNFILVVDFQQQTKVWLEKKEAIQKSAAPFPPHVPTSVALTR